MKTLVLTISLLFSQLTFAECPTFRFIDKGQPAPCDGAFFNREAERKLKDQHSTMKGDIKNLERKLELTELQIEEVQSKSNIYEAEMKRQEKMRKDLENDFRNGVIIGVVGTALSVLLAGMLAK
jgi:hypothetical protein